MGKAEEYTLEIRKMDRGDLIKLWEEHVEKDFDENFWKTGKNLEYVVIRAFEMINENDENLIDYMKKNLPTLKEMDIIKEMQAFLNE